MDNTIIRNIFIDAGIENIHIKAYDVIKSSDSEKLISDIIIQNKKNLGKLFEQSGVMELFTNGGTKSENGSTSVYITGKLAEVTKTVLGQGELIMPAAVLWSAAKYFLHREENKGLETIGIIDLSASGYMNICIDKNENLKNDLLIVNPRCGAGTGVNLNRILEKLDIRREDVDNILANYLGAAERDKRAQIPVRADRCGVFSSSATISDKNQGIPLDYALGVTMKSEIKKPCEKMYEGA